MNNDDAIRAARAAGDRATVERLTREATGFRIRVLTDLVRDFRVCDDNGDLVDGLHDNWHRTKAERDRDGVDPRWDTATQLTALKLYLGDRVEMLEEHTESDYQGDHFALFRVKDDGRFVLWRDSFGSCSGCDDMEGSDLAYGRKRTEASLAEGNTHQFATLEGVQEYLQNPADEYSWRDCALPIRSANLVPT